MTNSPFAKAATRPLVADPTDNQVRFIENLIAERNWQGAPNQKYVARTGEIATALRIARDPAAFNATAVHVASAPFIGGKLNQLLDFAGYKPLTKAGASAMIDAMLDLPKFEADAATPAVTDFPEVPAGRYAIRTNDGAHNDIAFYKVDRPTEGKWAGRVFVKLMQSDEEIALNHAAQRGVLARIAEVGPEAASALYGQEIGKCGVCGRTLTNDDSRAVGIGPKCRQSF